MGIANLQYQEDCAYEEAISNAPKVLLTDDIEVTPQHFFKYHHTLESVRELLADIEFETSYRLVASEHNGLLRMQVAMLSADNYQSGSKKLLFGRSWPIEVNLPTSELLQTALLALYVAREHEIRERYTLSVDGAITTPLNNHQDFPLIVKVPHLLSGSANQLTKSGVERILKQVRFLDQEFSLERYVEVDGDNVLISVLLLSGDDELPEFRSTSLHLVCSLKDENAFYYELMEGLLKISKQYVAENFKFRGVARFSKNHCVVGLARLNRDVRDPSKLAMCELSSLQAAQLNYEVDATRMPNGCEQLMANFIKENGEIDIANRHLYPF
ncbi:hypothetical protein PCIT_a1558 [Pseudoalteromonas citrea]|uniref:Uncharacterized protein n=2 Tax=Pseudoalteromonas citrea TaxID=43655 RepID=A0AAD4FTZ9_9GAMM|nr:hypothetical protein [Pseudoalteromonas citrea]KAF7775379.1 hypothetical protein PCIT_a1558 [Pseudoalteromonas citrea]